MTTDMERFFRVADMFADGDRRSGRGAKLAECAGIVALGRRQAAVVAGSSRFLAYGLPDAAAADGFKAAAAERGRAEFGGSWCAAVERYAAMFAGDGGARRGMVYPSVIGKCPKGRLMSFPWSGKVYNAAYLEPLRALFPDGAEMRCVDYSNGELARFALDGNPFMYYMLSMSDGLEYADVVEYSVRNSMRGNDGLFSLGL